MGLEAVIERRRAQRCALMERAAQFVAGLEARLRVRAAVVFGSVARGDFNRWSDIDVLVVADGLPEGPLQRLDLMDPWPPGVQPIAWTPEEWEDQLARGNPIAREAETRGVWLVGSAERSGRG